MFLTFGLLPSDTTPLFKYLVHEFECEKRPRRLEHIAISSFVLCVRLLIFVAGASKETVTNAISGYTMHTCDATSFHLVDVLWVCFEFEI